MRIAKSLAIPAALVVAAVFATPSVAATQTPSIAPSASGPTTQGIIMSDGRICNPRWGC